MLRQLIAVSSALVVTATLALTTPTDASALTARCAVINSKTVGGYNWATMPTSRSCRADLTYGTSGLSHLAEHTIEVHYSEKATSTRELQKATVHELAHQVEWRTTAAHRARLYSYLNIKNPTGNYFAFNDSYYYSGPLSRWMLSPRERLAESVVNCTYGSPDFTGMSLVPARYCTSFLAEFRASLAVAH